MQSIKAVRVQVISNTIASPPFSSTRVWSISFSVGPAYPQVGWLIGYKVVHLVNDQLIIPLLILSWTFSYAQEDIWSHTGNENRESQHWIEIVTPNFHSLISCVYWGYWIQQRCNTLILYLWTSLTNRVWSSRSLLGRRLSQIRFWLVLTATPLHTQREQRTSRIWQRKRHSCQTLFPFCVKICHTSTMCQRFTCSERKLLVIQTDSLQAVMLGAHSQCARGPSSRTIVLHLPFMISNCCLQESSLMSSNKWQCKY